MERSCDGGNHPATHTEKITAVKPNGERVQLTRFVCKKHFTGRKLDGMDVAMVQRRSG